MKNILIIIIGLVFAASCTTGTREEGKGELLPNPEKYVQDGYAELPDTLKPKFEPDTTIGQIRLISSENVGTYLGKDVMDRLVDNGLPSASVISSNAKQRLTFYFHPGGVKEEFSEYKVSHVQQKDRNDFVARSKEFVTESGIKLGMTMGEFRSIKGEPDSVTTDKTTIYHYRIEDFKNSKFLKKYNMPMYYANYNFSNGYLIEFKFGFEYP